MLLSAIIAICCGTVAMGDPPITPPVDPSVIPAVTTTYVSPQPALHVLETGELRATKKKIIAYGQLIWRWEGVLGLHRTRFSAGAERTQSLPYAQWVLKVRRQMSAGLHVRAKRRMASRIKTFQGSIRQMRLSMGQPVPSRLLAGDLSLEAEFVQMRRLAANVYTQYVNPPQKTNFECIHRYEGSWTDEDSGHNGHYGGVQMGKSEWDKFGRPYTGKEYPYQASKLDQLWAAYRYWLVSGFNPWPATARDCGLL